MLPVLFRFSTKHTFQVAKILMQAQTKKPVESSVSSSKKQTRLGLEAKKDENLSEWYTQVRHLSIQVHIN